MHNQDTARDDFMEALMAMFVKLKEWYEKQREDFKKENKDTVNELSDSEKIDKFKESMKYIIETNISEEVNGLAQKLFENPIEGMTLIKDMIQNNKQEIYAQFDKINEKNKSAINEMKTAINKEYPENKKVISALDSLEKRTEINDILITEMKLKDEFEKENKEVIIESELELEPKNIKDKEQKLVREELEIER